MTSEKQEEAGPVTVQVGVCSSCHALFLISGDRETSPCHGADPLVILATLAIAANGDVAGVWGQPPAADAPDITEEPASPVEEGAPPPAAEAREAAPEEGKPLIEWLPEVMADFLRDRMVNAEILHEVLVREGAEPEAASTAVGRLVAVRELVQSLAPPREPAPVAPASPEAESSPENTSPPPLTTAAGGV